MDKITVISAYLSLIFDNEIDTTEIITREIGLVPSNCKDKKDRRKSPFKEDNLPGFRDIVTDTVETYYLEDVTKILLDLINPYLIKIKNVIDLYDGKAEFLIVTEMIDNTSALLFNRSF